MTGSRKPADRLADLREEIKALEAEEESLRQGFIAGTLSLEGDDFTVVVETKINERIDSKAMRANVAESIWRPFLIATPTTYVTTHLRSVRPTTISSSEVSAGQRDARHPASKRPRRIRGRANAEVAIRKPEMKKPHAG